MDFDVVFATQPHQVFQMKLLPPVMVISQVMQVQVFALIAFATLIHGRATLDPANQFPVQGVEIDVAVKPAFACRFDHEGHTVDSEPLIDDDRQG